MSLLLLILLGIIMAVFSFLGGILPLFLNIRQDGSYLSSLFGAGLLIGSALGVIIPEGILLIVEFKESVEAVIALCLITGFCVMILFEKLSATLQNWSKIASDRSSNFSTLLGFLMHSLADGIAFGSVAISGNLKTEFIVFLAVIIHKFPAAFGLSCFLLGNGESFKNIKRFQILFSVTAVQMMKLLNISH